MRSHVRHQLRVAVYLFLLNKKNILLVKRHNTGWKDGSFSLPSGHLEKDEEIPSAMIREAKEEIGITIKKIDLTVSHVMHRTSDKEYLDFFFIATKWKGTPHNAEPSKCSEVSWRPISRMPKKTLKHIKVAFQHIKNNIVFSELRF